MTVVYWLWLHFLFLFFFSLFWFLCVRVCVYLRIYVRVYLAIPFVSANDNVKHTKSNMRHDNKINKWNKCKIYKNSWFGSHTSLHWASILQPAAPPQVVAFESWTISAPICLNRFICAESRKSDLWTCVCVFAFSSSVFAFLIEKKFSFKSLFAIWSLSPQRFHYYFFISIVSWQYQKHSTILILVLCLLCAHSMASMVSCNSVTTSKLGLASRTTDTDVIMLPRTSLSHLQSYLSLARFILNFYFSCGCWLTYRRSSTSISLGTKRTSEKKVFQVESG